MTYNRISSQWLQTYKGKSCWQTDQKPSIEKQGYLHQLIQTAKENLVINCESVATVFNVVVFNTRPEAYTQSVVPLMPVARPHQEQTVDRLVQKFLALLPRNLTMQPSRTDKINACLP